MKQVSTFLLVAFSTTAFAWGDDSAVARAAAQSGASTSGASSGGVSSDSSLYVLPAPVNAAPLPAGLCIDVDQSGHSILWNGFSQHSGQVRTNMACLEKLIELERARRAPAPQPVQVLVQSPPAVVKVVASRFPPAMHEKAKKACGCKL